MSQTLYWMHCGGCDGDTMSLLSAESPDLVEVLATLDIDVLWHPSLSALRPAEHDDLLERLLDGDQPLDFLCLEGAVLRGPAGTGVFDTRDGKPKKDIFAGLARHARYVLAVGTCASFGGVGSDGPIEACGAQFLRWDKGGFLGAEFKSPSGYPVINLPGCPAHCDPVVGTLQYLAAGTPLPLTEWNAPEPWYGMLVHQGCTRNEYHEYRVEEQEFGEKGCLFFPSRLPRSAGVRAV